MAHIVTRTGIGKPIPSAPLFLDVAGDVNFDTALGVGGVSTFADLVTIQRTGNDISLETRVPGDAEPLFYVVRDGQMAWGAGAASPVDTFLARTAVSTLSLTGSIVVTVDSTVNGNSLVLGNLTVNGNSTLGNDETTDTTSFNSRITTDFVPSADNTVDLGSSLLGWKDLFITGNAVLGTSSTDNVVFNSYIQSPFVPFSTNVFDLGAVGNKWRDLFLAGNLSVDGNTTLGDLISADTVTFNSRVSSILEPAATATHDLGSTLIRWRSLFLSDELRNAGNTFLGDSSADTISMIGSVNTDVVPDVDVTHDLGSATFRWANLFTAGVDMSGSLTVAGDAVFGTTSANTVTFNSRIDSDFVPTTDDTYDLGTTALRWQTLHVGPGSVVVHNDNTDTLKATFGYTGSDASIVTDAASALLLRVGVTNGLFLATDGKVGVNKAASLGYGLDVDADAGFSGTVYANQTTGTALFVESNLVVKGDIEADTSDNTLNIGVSADTEYINIGTGLSLQTIDIGTGAGPTVINIGSPNDTVNISGTVNNIQTINTAVTDKSFTLNAGGANGTTPFSGIFIQEASSTQLSVDDALWQSVNIVRYNMADTGAIQIGDLITITGFTNNENNGSYTVTSVSAGVYVEVTNSNRSDNTLDETGATAFSTDPTTPASIQLSGAADAWELYSTLNESNYFRFQNTGGNTTFTSSATELTILAPGSTIVPFATGHDLGTAALRWDLFGGAVDADSLAVSGTTTLNGNTTIGDAALDTAIFNAIPSFTNKIGSSLIPFSGTLDLGSAVDTWRDLYLSGSADIDGSLDVAVNADIDGDLTVLGSTTLGDAATDLISFVGEITGSIIPTVAGTSDLGSATNPWDNIYVGTLALGGFTEGSVLFVDSLSQLAENNGKFFWDNTNFYLGLGTPTPDKHLHILDSVTVGMKLTDGTDGYGVFSANAGHTSYTGSMTFSSTNAANLGTATTGNVSLILGANGETTTNGAFAWNTSTAVITNTYAVSNTDTVIPVDTSNVGINADCTITLPAATTRRILVIKDVGNQCASTNKNILLTPQVGETVEFETAGSAFRMDVDGMSLTLHSDGVSAWYII